MWCNKVAAAFSLASISEQDLQGQREAVRGEWEGVGRGGETGERIRQMSEVYYAYRLAHHFTALSSRLCSCIYICIHICVYLLVYLYL